MTAPLCLLPPLPASGWDLAEAAVGRDLLLAGAGVADVRALVRAAVLWDCGPVARSAPISEATARGHEEPRYRLSA